MKEARKTPVTIIVAVTVILLISLLLCVKWNNGNSKQHIIQ